MLISVLTPSFGYARYLGTALASAQSSSAVAVQHVVVDGASQDGSKQLLESWPDKSVDWISEPDEGQSDALNKALAMAKGDIIGWLNADEFYLPGTLELVAKVMDENRDVDVLYGDVLFVDEQGRLMRMLATHPWAHLLLETRGCTLTTAATFFRRSVLPDEPFNPRYRVVMDWDLFLNLKARGAAFRYIPRPLAAFRVHDARVTAGDMNRDSDEHKMIRRRYGTPRGVLSWRRRSGDLVHGLAKVASGARRREKRVRRLDGQPLRVLGLGSPP